MGRRRVDQLISIIAVAVGLAIVASLGQGYGNASIVVFVLFCAVFAATSLFGFRMITSLADTSLDVTGRIVDTEREQLEREKKILVDGLSEFKADAAFGKIDAADYAHLKGTAEARAMQIIRRLKDTDAYWLEQAEKLVSSRLGSRPELPPSEAELAKAKQEARKAAEAEDADAKKSVAKEEAAGPAEATNAKKSVAREEAAGPAEATNAKKSVAREEAAGPAEATNAKKSVAKEEAAGPAEATNAKKSVAREEAAGPAEATNAKKSVAREEAAGPAEATNAKKSVAREEAAGPAEATNAKKSVAREEAAGPAEATNAKKSVAKEEAAEAEDADAKKPVAKAKPRGWGVADAAVFDDRPVDFADGACAGCETANPEDARFCVGCGRPRSGAPALQTAS